MALGVDDVLQESLRQLNKNQISGYLNGNEYNNIIERVNLDWFNDNASLYESSGKNTDDMKVLKATTNIMVTSGVGPLPTDYYHYDKVQHRYYKPDGTSEMRPLDDKTTSDPDFGFFAASNKYPAFEVKGGNIEVEPKSINQITLDYLRYPATPVWGYTISGGREVYDASTSTDFELPEYAFSDIVNRVVALVSVSIKDQIGLMYSAQNENISNGANQVRSSSEGA